MYTLLFIVLYTYCSKCASYNTDKYNYTLNIFWGSTIKFCFKKDCVASMGTAVLGNHRRIIIYYFTYFYTITYFAYFEEFACRLKFSQKKCRVICVNP